MTQAAAWRLLEAGDTLGISRVESTGFRMLLKRAKDLAELQSQHGHALRSIEDLAQLLALWKPGVYSKEAEEAFSTLDSPRENGRIMRTRPWPACSIARTARCCTPLCGHSLGTRDQADDPM